MSVHGRFKCPTCGTIRHIDIDKAVDAAPVCPADHIDMTLTEAFL